MAMTVGHVVGLWRYPVKSMAGEELGEVEVSWQGLVGDRRWAFVRPGPPDGFPWLTIRQRSDLWHYRPCLGTPDNPDRSPVSVRTPAGRELDVADPELARELGSGVCVTKQNRGTFDAMPLSLLTTSSVDALATALGTDLDARRFRPNLVVEPVARDACPEQAWVGRTLRAGTLVLRADQPNVRCAVVNVDPRTGRRDARVLRGIVRDRERHLGVRGCVVHPGRVALGDPVLLD